MKLENHKKYRDRFGTIHTIMGQWEPVRPGHFCFQDDDRNMYTANGMKRLSGDEDPLDLVREVTEEDPSEKKDFKMHIVKGDKSEKT